VLYCVQSVQLGKLISVQFITGSVKNWKVKRKHFCINWASLIHKIFLEHGIDTCLQNVPHLCTTGSPLLSVLRVVLLLLLHVSLPINEVSTVKYNLFPLGIYHF